MAANFGTQRIRNEWEADTSFVKLTKSHVEINGWLFFQEECGSDCG